MVKSFFEFVFGVLSQLKFRIKRTDTSVKVTADINGDENPELVIEVDVKSKED